MLNNTVKERNQNRNNSTYYNVIITIIHPNTLIFKAYKPCPFPPIRHIHKNLFPLQGCEFLNSL